MKIKKEEELEKQEERQKNSIKYKIEKSAVGKKIKDIKKEFEQNSISEYSIQYISSKLYKEGIVAFVDIMEDVFYVVKDNKKEDLVEMPKLTAEMKKDEIIKLLTKNGLNYEIDVCECYLLERSGKLRTYQYSSGTMLPRGLIVNIEIYEEIMQKNN